METVAVLKKIKRGKFGVNLIINALKSFKERFGHLLPLFVCFLLFAILIYFFPEIIYYCIASSIGAMVFLFVQLILGAAVQADNSLELYYLKNEYDKEMDRANNLEKANEQLQADYNKLFIELDIVKSNFQKLKIREV